MKEIFFNYIRSKPVLVLVLSEIFESVRNKWLIAYGLSFFVFTFVLLSYGTFGSVQALSGVLSQILLIIPLFSLLYGAISFAEAAPFMELILVRNISRTSIFSGKFLGLGIGLSLSFLCGILLGIMMLPNVIQQFDLFILLLFLGVCLHFIFLGISFILAVQMERKETLLGMVLVLWFYFYIIYDLLLMALAILFREYPLDIPVITALLLNPIDLTRVIFLIKLNLDSIAGFSMALVKKNLGGHYGFLITAASMLLWIALLYFFGLRKFKQKVL